MAENLFKKQSQKMKEEKEMEKQEQVVMTEVALSIFKNPMTGEWSVAKIGFNPIFNKVGEVEILYSAPQRDLVIEHFKIATIKNGLIG